ncbi:MAG: Ig-like domain-containing protein, partial [Methanobrevibacter sp.]|nr:Ig-like domain-containing protein [Methanobrevibacter sp.]
NVNGVYGGNIVLTATLRSGSTPLEGKTVTFYVNGISVGTRVTGSDGVASYVYTGGAGTFDWSASYAGDANYTNYTSSNVTLAVDKADTVHSVSNAVGFHGYGIVLTATLRHTSGVLANHIVHFYVNNQLVGSNHTDSNGVARFTYVGNVGTYSWSATYNGNELYKSSVATASLVINKLNTIITSSSPSFTGTYDKNVILSATLRDSYGKALDNKEVQVWVNGVKVGTVRTNIAGLASFSYKVAKTGNLDVSFRYVGENSHIASFSNNNKLTVKKHSKVAISNKIKRSKGSSTLTSTIKNSGPDKLTAKVTYKFAKGLTIGKVTSKLGKFKVNKKKRTITFNLNNFNKGKKLSKLVVRFNTIVKGKKYVTNKVTSTNTLSVKASNK